MLILKYGNGFHENKLEYVRDVTNCYPCWKLGQHTSGSFLRTSDHLIS